MNQELENLQEKSINSLLEIEAPVSKSEFSGLPRTDRIYNAIMFPRHFNLSAQDEEYLQLMKSAYNILITSPTDQMARHLIREVRLGCKLSNGDVIELIRCTKEVFGKIEIRNVDFDRMVQRHRLIDLYNRCKLAGDLFNERLTLYQIEKLDALGIKEKLKEYPAVPALPNVTYKLFDEAIVESTPQDTDAE